MRKTVFAILAIAGILAASSCMKDEISVTLTEVNDGDIKITVADKSGEPIANQKVKLGSYYDAIEENNTNSEGVVEFKDILMGTYAITMEDVTDGNMEYNVVQPVQSINSIVKEYTITPSDYSGSYELTVFNDRTGEPIIGINVGVFKSEDVTSYDFEDLTAIVLEDGVTDENGLVTFDELPLNQYGIIVYMNATSYQSEPYSFNISYRDENVKRYMYFYNK